MAKRGTTDGAAAALDPLLAAAGARLDAAGVRELIAGVLATPAGLEAEDWLRLVAVRPSRRLKAAVMELAGEMAAAAAARPGLDADARLAALRAELARRGLDGFIVPRADEHQNEFVPARAERLAWLTGFTGSAGLAVVLRETAAVFVDGRYTLQVRDQVDVAAYETRHIIEQPAAEWIAETLGAGGRLGYDPWLHAANEVKRLGAAAARAGGELLACPDNPVDAVWPDQPARPLGPVVPHPRAFAGRGAAEKRADLADALARAGTDAAVLTAPDSIAWLLNIRGGDTPNTPLPLAFAVLERTGAVELFIDARKLMPATAAHLGNSVRVSPGQAFGAALDRLGAAGARVGVDPAGAAAAIFDRLRAAGAAIVPMVDPCALPKAIKNPVEIEGTRAAHRRDGAALSRFLAWLERAAAAGGVSEIGAVERLAGFRGAGEHFRGLSFDTISGAGANGAIVHYRVTPESDSPLVPGTLYLVDSGAQYLDGTTDVTRTVFVGGDGAAPTAEHRSRFTLVLKGHIAIATTRFPEGTTGSQLDTLARHALWQAGLDYDHGTGHGVGSYLGVHEGPQRVSKLPNRVALAPGMIVSNEPGYYKTGAYGIRIENLVVVVPAAARAGAEKPLLEFETLTLAPIDRRLVDPALLSDDEIGWLDRYHARVRATHIEALEGDEVGWLIRATAPLGT